MDRDKDGMVSLEEFLGYTKSEEYKTDEDWKPVVDQDIFSEDDLKKFEEDYNDDYYDYEYDDDGNIIGFKTKWVVELVCVVHDLVKMYLRNN